MQRIRILMQREGELGVLVVAAVTITGLLAAFMSSQFFSAVNLQSMAVQISGFGFLALGMGIAMLSGGIDLSIVSAMTLAGISGAYMVSGRLIPVTETNGNMLAVLAAVVALLVGLACGALNGVLIAKVSVPPILATLSTMILFSGIGMALTTGQSVSVVVPVVAKFATATVAGAPVIFLLLVVVFMLVGLLLTWTRSGRRLYLFGENQVALRFAGGRTERTIILSYMLIGLLVGLAAMIMVSRVNSARTGYGESYLLQAILVVVLAGFNPDGGRGRVSMLGLALMLLQFVQSAFNVLQFSPFMKNLIWGAMLLAVMVANHYVRQWNRRVGTGPGGTTPAATSAQPVADQERAAVTVP